MRSRFIEMVLLGTHNVCFGSEIGKLVISYTPTYWRPALLVGLQSFRMVELPV